MTCLSVPRSCTIQSLVASVISRNHLRPVIAEINNDSPSFLDKGSTADLPISVICCPHNPAGIADKDLSRRLVSVLSEANVNVINAIFWNTVVICWWVRRSSRTCRRKNGSSFWLTSKVPRAGMTTVQLHTLIPSFRFWVLLSLLIARLRDLYAMRRSFMRWIPSGLRYEPLS